MKKLNITKEQFNKSRYFKNKYGNLEYVSESGKVFKTDKGKILMFKEGFFGDLGEEIGDRLDSGVSKIRKFFHGKPKFKEGDSVMICMIEWSPCSVSHGGTITKTKWGDRKWYYEVDFGGDGDLEWWPEDALAIDTDPEAGSEKLDRKSLIEKYPEFVKRAKTILGKKTRKELGIDESTKRFGKKFAKEGTESNPRFKCMEDVGVTTSTDGHYATFLTDMVAGFLEKQRGIDDVEYGGDDGILVTFSDGGKVVISFDTI